MVDTSAVAAKSTQNDDGSDEYVPADDDDNDDDDDEESFDPEGEAEERVGLSSKRSKQKVTTKRRTATTKYAKQCRFAMLVIYAYCV